MNNDNRGSDSVNRQSRRRTLLCCTTLCLFLFLILFLLASEVFHSRSVDVEKNFNEKISLNLMKFRFSLIQCGRSVVEKDSIYQMIPQLTELIKNFSIKQKNKNDYSVNERIFNEEIIVWLEYILKQCFQARQFSIIEQQKPTIIRRLISVVRKEFLYIAGFFIKEF